MPASGRFHMVSLGCAKNTVDADSMAQLLARDGLQDTREAEAADVVVVNTCGFIAAAREESYAVLREFAARKRKGQLLIATGCLTQRYGAEVVRNVPGVDGVLGTRRWMDIVELLHSLRRQDRRDPLYHLLDEARTVGEDERHTLRASVTGASAYLKIADGCRRPCAFCAIPLIKGTAVSRPPRAILDEARRLVDSGVREIILIAQDTTDYGHDLGLKDGLAQLLERLADIVPEQDWIRLMYAYPGFVTDRLVEVMATRPQVLPYLDMPLQHAHPATLKRMRRPSNLAWIHRTVEKMRAAMPDLAMRTTFIVGYPGETESEFEALLGFVREMRFDRVGVFQFSFEEGTASASLGDPVPQQVKEARYEALMELQQAISLQANQACVGRTLPVLVEGVDPEQAVSVGRSYRDAPEIDGLVLIEGEVATGSVLPVRIHGAMPYDLTGVPASQGDGMVELRAEERDSSHQ